VAALQNLLFVILLYLCTNTYRLLQCSVAEKTRASARSLECGCAWFQVSAAIRVKSGLSWDFYSPWNRSSLPTFRDELSVPTFNGKAVPRITNEVAYHME
jgi:hypothetical protein